jgi:hypothetical protein
MGEKFPRMLPKMATFTSLSDSFTCRKFWHGTDGFTSPPKEGALRNFFARKIRLLRPGLNPRTRVPKASTLTSRPPKPLYGIPYDTKLMCTNVTYFKFYVMMVRWCSSDGNFLPISWIIKYFCVWMKTYIFIIVFQFYDTTGWSLRKKDVTCLWGGRNTSFLAS